MNSLYQNYGMGYTGEQIAKSSILSGGHPHARAIANDLQAEGL